MAEATENDPFTCYECGEDLTDLVKEAVKNGIATLHFALGKPLALGKPRSDKRRIVVTCSKLHENVFEVEEGA